MPRKARIDAPGALHHIIVRGIVYVTGYSYDAAGNLRSITYPTGQTIDYEPDAADPARIGAVVLNPYGSNQTLASAMAYTSPSARRPP